MKLLWTRKSNYILDKCDLKLLPKSINADRWSCTKSITNDEVSQNAKCRLLCLEGYDLIKGNFYVCKNICTYLHSILCRFPSEWQYYWYYPRVTAVWVWKFRIKENDEIFIDVKKTVIGWNQIMLLFLVKQMVGPNFD